MADSKGAVILLAILAVAGLGLSGYMFTMDLLTEDVEYVDDDSQNLKLVALWDDLDQNITNNPSYSTQYNFLVGYSNQLFLDSNYVNVINNTRFTLPTPGLYKINLDVLFNDISASRSYWAILKQNISNAAYFDRWETGTADFDPFHHVDSSVYIESVGGEDTYYEINGYSSMDDFWTSETVQTFNQLSIEYVIE